MTAAVTATASVVVPAHNEATVIARCLTALLTGVPEGTLDVVVVCNGCSDRTADVVRDLGLPVRVLEVAQASKIVALRAGDAATDVFPRFYLDADVELPGASVVALAGTMTADGVLAARPPVVYDTAGADFWVRHYYAARSRVPALLSSLWGAGVYALSREGHARVAPWPDVLADDLHADRQFARPEIVIPPIEPVLVRVPRERASLVKVLTRSYRGKQDESTGSTGEERTFVRTLLGVARLAVTKPAHGFDAAVYAGFAVMARLLLVTGSSRKGAVWARDESTRAA